MGVEKPSRTRPMWREKNPPELKGRGMILHGSSDIEIEHSYIPVGTQCEPAQPTARPWSTSFHPDFMRCPRCKIVGGWRWVAPAPGGGSVSLYRCGAVVAAGLAGYVCGYYRDASEAAPRIDFEIERDDVLAIYGVWHSHLNATSDAGRAIRDEAYAKLRFRLTFHQRVVYPGEPDAEPRRLLVMSPTEVIAALLPNRMLVKPAGVHGLPERKTVDQKRALDRLAETEARLAAKAREHFGSRVLDEAKANEAEYDAVKAALVQRNELRAISQSAKNEPPEPGDAEIRFKLTGRLR